MGARGVGPYPIQVENDYYSKRVWDEEAWVKVISVEYEQLIQNYPFAERLKPLSERGEIRLLDVGSGTGIFPSYLDKVLPEGFAFATDLLDISKTSLRRAERRFASLEHFRVAKTINSRIEDIPNIFLDPKQRYDLIWSIHSFTTVDVQKMREVYYRLVELLSPSGFLFVYQLAATSAYQDLHAFYRANHPQGKDVAPFMQYEDSKEILRNQGLLPETHELFFDHKVDESDEELLEKYLHKCVLDDSFDAIQFFSPMLPKYFDESTRSYRFPQLVNFGVIRPNE